MGNSVLLHWNRTSRSGAFAMALALLLALSSAEGQSPSAAIPQAMRAMTEGFGGCLGQVATRSVALSYFADVRFVRGTCVREHGDPTTALVGIDSDSVLYLASSLETLKFLAFRHPPQKLDSASVVAYARQALEVAGLESGESTLLRSLEDVPDYARKSVQKGATPLISVHGFFGNNAWDVAMTFREAEGFYRAAIVRHSFWLFANGTIENASSRVIWTDPGHM
jgi:hypothetical protein